MKTRAAVARTIGGAFTIETVDLRPPGPGEVLVKMAATGLCHTDLTVLDGQMPSAFPIILGHEGAGTVVECGPGVDNFARGDHVILFSVPECGHCRGCQRTDTNYCDDLYPMMMSADTPFSGAGGPIARFVGLGTFAEHSVIKTTSVAKIRKDAPLDLMSLLGCGVATGVGSSINTAGVEPGSRVIVFGLGGIGLNAVQGAKIAGASQIVGVDTNPDKEVAARRFGATEFVNPRTVKGDLVQHLLELTRGGGDHVLECAGNAEVQRLAYAVTHVGWGVCVFVGLPPSDQHFTAAGNELIRGKTLKGGALGDIKRHQLPQFVDWYVDGKLKLDDLVSHRMRLEDINAGYDLMRQGKSVRTLVIY